MKVLRQLDRWMFGYGSGVSLGVFRILMGALASASLIMTAANFYDWYSEKGYVPWELTQRYMGERYRLIALPFPVSDEVMLAFYILVTVAAITTALGLFSRVSSIVLALGMVTLHHRNPMILHSGDSLMRLCLIYLAVSPCGVACSLDKLRADKKDRGALAAGPDLRLPSGGISETMQPTPSASAKLVPLWGQRIVQLQIATLYLTTFWHKMYGDYWRDGTATYYPAHLSEFDRFPLPTVLDNHPFFVAAATYGTLAAELALGTLVFWKPARKYVLISGLLMHAYIEYRFNIPLFSFIICSCYICFYDGEEVEAWWKKVRKQ